MRNVLLISPLDPEKPSQLKLLMGGENTYTLSLLNHPPRGVKYTHFQEALERGEIQYTRWQTSLSNLMRLRILPPDAGYQCIQLKKRFDLIHCHSYNLKIEGNEHPPVVLGSSSSSYLTLRDYFGWSEKRIKIHYRIRKLLHKRFSIYDPELLPYKAKQVILFSEFARLWHKRLGQPGEKLMVLYPGLVKQYIKPRKNKHRITILFAGVWFKRKGGHLLLEAFARLKSQYPNLKLIMIGELPNDIQINDPAIEHHIFVTHDRLHKEFFAQTDIFVHVPPMVEGFGMVVPEALSHGLCVVVSDICALPELVNHGKAGVIVRADDVNALMKAIVMLIKSPTKRKMLGQGAKAYFDQTFSLAVCNPKLSEIYTNACKAIP